MQSESADISIARARQSATYVLAASIFGLSGALVYFTWNLASISEQVPAILKSVEQTSVQLAPVLADVVELKVLVPAVLNEVSETRKLVTPILNEIRLTREQIPEILHQVEEIRKVIPQVLQTTDDAVKEIKATRPLVPKILDEIKQTREAIPPMLDRVDKLILSASKAGKEASKGAVSGVLTGIVTAPFEIMGSLGKRLFSFSDEEIKKLSDRDIELTEKAIAEVLASNKINQVSDWENPNNNTEGAVTLLQDKMDNGRICKLINMKVKKKKQLFLDKNLTVCLNDKGEWEQLTSQN